VWTTIAYTAGSHLDVLYPQLVHYEAYVAAAIGVAIVAYVARKLWLRRRTPDDQDQAPLTAKRYGQVGIGRGAAS